MYTHCFVLRQKIKSICFLIHRKAFRKQMRRMTINSRTARKWLLYVPHTCPFSDSGTHTCPVCIVCPMSCVPCVSCPSLPYVLCVQFPVCLLHMSFGPICLVCPMGHKAHRGMGHTRPMGLKDMGDRRHMGPRHTGHRTHKTYGTKYHRMHGAMKDKVGS